MYVKCIEESKQMCDIFSKQKSLYIILIVHIKILQVTYSWLNNMVYNYMGILFPHMLYNYIDLNLQIFFHIDP